jgi:putative tricarboxylic transport membrane protein
MGKFRHPGPGFLPFGLAILLSILSLSLILRRSGKGSGRDAFWPERTWVRPLMGVIVFVVYSFLLGKLGFLPTTFLFLLLWMGAIEHIGWRTLLILSTAVTAAVYAIFGYLLEVPLPMGFLEW